MFLFLYLYIYLYLYIFIHIDCRTKKWNASHCRTRDCRNTGMRRWEDHSMFRSFVVVGYGIQKTGKRFNVINAKNTTIRNAKW